MMWLIFAAPTSCHELNIITGTVVRLCLLNSHGLRCAPLKDYRQGLLYRVTSTIVPMISIFFHSQKIPPKDRAPILVHIVDNRFQNYMKYYLHFNIIINQHSTDYIASISTSFISIKLCTISNLSQASIQFSGLWAAGRADRNACG